MGAFACLAPLSSAAWSAPVGMASESRKTLTRVLKRGLRGGSSIVVERSWQIDFSRQGQGTAITGTQLSAHVEAPEELAGLARIEEQRSTQSMFPIFLGQDGLIMVAAESNANSDAMGAALAEADRILKERKIPDASADAQRADLARLQLAGTTLLDRMPRDLFRPSREWDRQTRQVPLPDGTTGEFELVWEASMSESGWMKQAKRTVKTRIGATERSSSETWTMAPA